MLLNNISILLDINCVKYILYHIYITRFDILGDIFFMQLKCIGNRYQEDYITIY